MDKNQRIVLASRPKGEPQPENFRMEEEDIRQPAEGQVLLRTLYLSLDPYMRGRMSAGPSYAPPVAVGDVMEGGAVSEVVESKSADVNAGDIVLAYTGWQKFAVVDAKGVRKLDPALGPVSYALGVLGMPGLTAYTGLENIGQPKSGETLVVAAASGAVGSVVGQIARIRGCRTVGIAGGKEKCDFVVNELRFDACLNHRSPNFRDELKAACTSGVDIYFENVGGDVFAAVLPLLNLFSRVPVCGLIAHYNDSDLSEGRDHVPMLMRAILTKRITFRGFIVGDYSQQFPEAIRHLSRWVREGEVKYREDIVDGFENTIPAFQGLLKGHNFGKLLVRVG